MSPGAARELNESEIRYRLRSPSTRGRRLVDLHGCPRSRTPIEPLFAAFVCELSKLGLRKLPGVLEQVNVENGQASLTVATYGCSHLATARTKYEIGRPGSETVATRPLARLSLPATGSSRKV